MALPPMIYKSNALIEAAYRLSVQEQRIVLACIAQVKRNEAVTDEVLYSVTAADLAKLSGTAIEGTYSELKDAALRLKRREVRLTEEPNGSGRKPKVMITGWVQTIFYIEGEGRVELRFTKDMLPYLTELSREFTKYALEDVVKMDSAYAIRLYEMLMQWNGVGKREIALEDFRNMLQLEGRYSSIKDFKLRVLQPAIDQINEHSPMWAKWDQRKTGRRVTHLSFTFGPKEEPKQVHADELAQHARPGETWEQLRKRLRDEGDRNSAQSRIGNGSIQQRRR